MSSHLREARPRRARARVLAAPFVLTVALGGGCFVQSEPAPAGQPAGQPNQTPATSGGGAPQTPPTIISNPPPPDRGGGTTTPSNLPAAPASGGQVQTRADGSCWWIAEPSPCPAGASCNPPPPMQVQCPAKP